MIRPEQLTIAPPLEAPALEDAVAAVVTAAVYLGSGWRYRTRTSHGDTIDVLESSSRSVGVGSSVLLRHTPEDVWLLPPHDGDAPRSSDSTSGNIVGGLEAAR
jgi:hypothetical protein